ncbi:hypothetical protein U1Q18_032199, partial [Sarracenia purpurea var. burkii]
SGRYRMHQKWLGKIFTHYGLITNLVIRSKRRQISKSKFDFVRFIDLEAVDRAIKMYDGVWCMNKKLVVKRLGGKKPNNRDWSQPHTLAVYTRGMMPCPPTPEMYVIEAENIDEEWLKLCDVGIVEEHTKLCSIQAAMVSLGVHDIKIKTLGDNKALIMFSDMEEKKMYLTIRRE